MQRTEDPRGGEFEDVGTMYPSLVKGIGCPNCRFAQRVGTDRMCGNLRQIALFIEEYGRRADFQGLVGAGKHYCIHWQSDQINEQRR